MENINLITDRRRELFGSIQKWNAAIAHELRTPVTLLRGSLMGLCEGRYESHPQLFQELMAQTENLILHIEELRRLSLAENNEHHLFIQVNKFGYL